MNLKSDVKVVNALTARIESTAINSAIVDVQGFEGCFWIVQTSTDQGAASISFTPQMSTANSTAALTNSSGILSSTKMVAGANYRLATLDVNKPTEQYQRLRITGSSSGYVNSILAVLYNGRRPGSTEYYGSTHMAGSTCVAGFAT